jgi:hypothetical protein
MEITLDSHLHVKMKRWCESVTIHHGEETITIGINNSGKPYLWVNKWNPSRRKNVRLRRVSSGEYAIDIKGA